LTALLRSTVESRWTSALALGIAAALALIGPGGATADELRSADEVLAAEPPEVAEELISRRILMMQDIGAHEGGTLFTALVIFEHPLEMVTELMRDGTRQTEYREDIHKLEVIEESENSRIDEQTLKIMFTKIVYRLRYERDPVTGRLSWQLDESFDNDVARVEGFWEFYGFEDGRTLGRFGTLVDVGPAVPGFIQNSMTKKTVVKVVENTRKWVNSDGKWRP
jgi:hypothetical protein